MMKKVSVFLVSILVLQLSGIPAYAQVRGGPDHFSSENACMAALQSGNYDYYRPSVLRQAVLAANEAVRPYEADHCVLMDVSDRVGGGRQWVPIRQGTPRIVSTVTGGTLRHGECNNRIYAEALFSRPVAAPAATTTFAPQQQAPVQFVQSPSLSDQALRELRDEIASLRNSQTQTRTEVDVDVDNDGMPGWLKAVIIGGAIAGGGWLTYKCITKWCKNENNNANVINLSTNPNGVVVIQK